MTRAQWVCCGAQRGGMGHGAMRLWSGTMWDMGGLRLEKMLGEAPQAALDAHEVGHQVGQLPRKLPEAISL